VQKLAALLIVLLAPTALAATPSEGVPLQVRRGFFTETDIGAFLTVGGSPPYYSNTQVFVQLGLGYQLTIGDGSALVPIGFHVAIGSNAQNCFGGLKSNGECSQADNFTMTFLSATVGYLFRLHERVYLGPKLIVGYTLLDPAPIYTADTPPAPVNGGVNVGAAASFEYATNMDHFSVGIDVAFRMVFASTVIPSISIYPRVQYTF
jgi:hypothetical protein